MGMPSVLLLVAAALVPAFPAAAFPAAAPLQDPAAAKKERQQADFRARYEAKLKEPWFADRGWLQDFDKAREAAATAKKGILGYFTRSYSSSPSCEKLEKGLLASEEFREFARDYVLFVHVASRLDGDRHARLLEEKGGGAVPRLLSMDAEGTVLAELDAATLDGLRAMARSAAEFRDLRSKKDPTGQETVKLLGMAYARGHFKVEEYRSRLAALQGLDGAALTERDAALVGLDVDVQLDRHRRLTAPDPALRLEIGRIFSRMYREGRVPVESIRAGPFAELLMGAAEADLDPEAFAFGVGLMKKCFGDQKRLETWFVDLQKRLDDLRAAAAAKKDGKTDPPKDGKKDAPKDGKTDESKDGKTDEPKDGKKDGK